MFRSLRFAGVLGPGQEAGAAEAFPLRELAHLLQQVHARTRRLLWEELPRVRSAQDKGQNPLIAIMVHCTVHMYNVHLLWGLITLPTVPYLLRNSNFIAVDALAFTIQCWGFVTFWCGSGSLDPHTWKMDPDPALDPTPYFSDFNLPRGTSSSVLKI